MTETGKKMLKESNRETCMSQIKGKKHNAESNDTEGTMPSVTTRGCPSGHRQRLPCTVAVLNFLPFSGNEQQNNCRELGTEANVHLQHPVLKSSSSSVWFLSHVLLPL